MKRNAVAPVILKPQSPRSCAIRAHSSESGFEAMLQDIERRSRDPFGRNRQSVRQLIDVEILEGFADPDEIDYARTSMQTYLGEVFMKQHPDQSIANGDSPDPTVAASGDFRDSLDDAEIRPCGCDSSKDEVCINCCTEKDLETIPRVPGVHIENSGHSLLGDIFNVVMPGELAASLGLVAAA